jgi:hypothetical protein
MISNSLETKTKQTISINDDSGQENHSICFEISHHERDVWCFKTIVENFDFLGQHDINSVLCCKNELQSFLTFLPTTNKH